ncbi:MAG: M48 family metalloprotease [Treponema sp.]|nr:M48 family metalloprotease [Treponema sp.]
MKKIIAIFGTALLTFMCTSCLSTFFTVMNIVDAGQAIVDASQSIKKASEDITPERQYYFGRTTAAQILTNYKIYDNKELTDYVNKICGAITICSDNPYIYNGYNVSILNTAELTGFATMGGHIFISRGLIVTLNSEDALAGVIAHEISHIQLAHSLKMIQKTRKNAALASTARAASKVNSVASSFGGSYSSGDMGEIVDVICDMTQISAMLSDTLMETGYSKKTEYEADAYALDLMYNAGYDPSAMLESLEALKKYNTGYSKTHPKAKTRISKINKKLKKMNYSVGGRETRDARFRKIVKK